MDRIFLKCCSENLVLGRKIIIFDLLLTKNSPQKNSLIFIKVLLRAPNPQIVKNGWHNLKSWQVKILKHCDTYRNMKIGLERLKLSLHRALDFLPSYLQVLIGVFVTSWLVWRHNISLMRHWEDWLYRIVGWKKGLLRLLDV